MNILRSRLYRLKRKRSIELAELWVQREIRLKLIGVEVLSLSAY